jgi:hypothetical protein
MKTVCRVLVLLLFFSSCITGKNDDLVSARWVFASTNAPALANMAERFETNYGVNGFQQVFAASKFIIRPDHSFDFVLFQNYRHGKWEHRRNQLLIRTEPRDTPITFIIDSIDYNFMELSIDSTNFQKFGRMVMPYENIDLFSGIQRLGFRLQLDNERYQDEKKDPYSKLNNWWRIKPLKSESTKEIKNRVLNLADFHLLMFEDALAREKKVITYNWFSSPLTVARNGLGLKSYKKIRTDWEECFYDSAQAWYGFLTLRSGFEKKMDFPEDVENPFERNKLLLQQYRKNLE